MTWFIARAPVSWHHALWHAGVPALRYQITHWPRSVLAWLVPMWLVAAEQPFPSIRASSQCTAGAIVYADDQLALWDVPSYEAAAAQFDASVNITAADLEGVNAFTVADTIIGGQLALPFGCMCLQATLQGCASCSMLPGPVLSCICAVCQAHAGSSLCTASATGPV